MRTSRSRLDPRARYKLRATKAVWQTATHFIGVLDYTARCHQHNRPFEIGQLHVEERDGLTDGPTLDYHLTRTGEDCVTLEDDVISRFWIWSAVLVLASTVLSAQAPLFSSGIDLVHMGVSVVDKDGEPFADLRLEDVELYEDGEVQDIQYFTRGLHTDTERMPMHVGLLFDASGSMDEDARFSQTAAIRFLGRLTYAEDITLVDFDNEVRVGRYSQREFPRLVERIRNRDAVGMTSFYDALGVYLDGAFEQEGRKVLLMYSDGEDTRSRMPFSDTVELVKASDVTVYGIGFQKHLRTSVRMTAQLRLQQLAEVTGGRCFFPTEIEELDDIYDQIATELETRYSFGYTSTNQRSDGAWRRVEVRIKETRPELRDVDVRAREGYYAPYVESPPQGR